MVQDSVPETLEQKKLALEIARLSRKWWQDPEYLHMLVPIILATLAFMAAQASGLFDRERTRLLNERKQLEAEVTQFRIEKREQAAEQLRRGREAERDRISGEVLREVADKVLRPMVHRMYQEGREFTAKDNEEMMNLLQPEYARRRRERLAAAGLSEDDSHEQAGTSIQPPGSTSKSP